MSNAATRLATAGISVEDINRLFRIASQLKAIDVKECNEGASALTEKAAASAEEKLRKIIGKYPGFNAYHQGDPRGASLWVIRPGDIPQGKNADSYYTNGIAVVR